MQNSTRHIAGLGLLTALVIILQFMGSFIHFGVFSISLVLIPIVVGASVYNSMSGAWLGFIFGVVVLLSGDAAPFLAINPAGTIFGVILKGILAGWGAGAIYGFFSKKTSGNSILPVIAAAISCPVINTGIFLIVARVFFYSTIASWASAAGYESVGAYFIFGFVGVNFILELLINVVLSPIIVRIINIGKRTI